jgi:cysteinyl-tRNA synthetase
MLEIYNTLTGEKDNFEPREDGKIQIFVCGPTVYDYSHIGHARTYIAFDVIAKYLKHKYPDREVFYLQNITDIDNKIITRAEELGKKTSDVAEEFTKAYFEDMTSIGVDSVTKYAPATEYIDEIVSQVKRLEEKGYAYFIENDGWYFDLSKDSEYGKLSGRTIESAEDAVTRIDDSVKKRNKGDFALWKLSTGEEPGWETELGYGRPGWHIEDTAITEKYFGQQYDLHGGARDLLFPHHEAEIAQMESITGVKPFVKYWVHTGFLTINGQKMSKSLGNFITIRDILKNYSKEALRFLMLSNHYRAPIDYSEESMKAAEAAVQRLFEIDWKMEYLNFPKSTESAEVPESIEKFEQDFENAMSDDFNTSQAIAAIFDFTKKINKFTTLGNVSKEQAQMVKKSLLKTAWNLFGIIPNDGFLIHGTTQDLIDARQQAREKKDFQTADKLRDQINSLGYQIDDTVYGPLVKKI